MDLKKMALAVACAAACALGAAETPKFAGLAKAQEVRAREGVGNFLAKIRAGKPVTVAYLGGSITAQNGWRVKTTKFLREKYPQAKVTEVHAAIGGTGSSLGVFRVGHDALRYDPDLLFVEFATNDGSTPPDAIWRQMEGIVRQTWLKDAKTDVVFAYTITAAMTNEYLRGECNRAASAMEQLADHYGIPSVNFGPRVAKLLAEDKLVMDPKAVVATAVPVESRERDKAIRDAMKNEKRMLFANDGVHPRDEGHELYLQSIVEGFKAMDSLPPADHAAKLAAAPFVADNLEAAKMLPISPAMLSGDWKKLGAKNDSRNVARFADRMGEVWEAATPGAKLSFRFRGRYCQIYDLLGPDGGNVQVKVDGKVVRKQARFDSYCTYYRLATLFVFSGADVEHAVELEVMPDQPSRQPVAFRLKDPAKELAEKKYNGTGFWPGAIQIVGDLL